MNPLQEFCVQVKDINLWSEIIFMLISYGISIGIGHIVVFSISDSMFKLILKEKYVTWEIGPYRWTTKWVGILERLIITTSIIFGVSGVLVIWYGIKIISKVNVWNEENKKSTNLGHFELVKYGRGRALFNNYLIGTALSLFFGAFGAQVFYWLQNKDYLLFSFSTVVIVIISTLSIICIKKEVEKESRANFTLGVGVNIP